MAVTRGGCDIESGILRDVNESPVEFSEHILVSVHTGDHHLKKGLAIRRAGFVVVALARHTENNRM